MPSGDLSRDEIIELVERIMLVEAGITGEAHDRLVERFADSVVHPAASELIFCPDKHFDAEPTAEQVVDAALGYRAIELGPGS